MILLRVLSLVRHTLPAVLVVAIAAASFAQQRAAVPADAAQQEALELVREVYGDEWKAARTNVQKVAFAKKLFNAAGEATHVANRFVLLKTGRDLSAKAGDVELAIQAIGVMDRHYEVDSYKLKGAAISQAVGSATTSKQRRAIAASALSLIDVAIDRDDFSAANYLGKLAVKAATASGDLKLATTVAARNRNVKKLAHAYQKVEPALATIQTVPTDPDANLILGRYHCFLKGDWAKGLPMLALGGDADSKRLAAQELRGVPASDEVALADAWWELGKKESDPAKSQIQLHAAAWYRRALPRLSGLTKIKVAKRVAQVADSSVGNASDTPREQALFNGKNLTGWKYLPVSNSNSKSKTNKTWRAERGSLVSIGGGDHNNLATLESYGDFKLSLQWRFRPGGELSPNGSGIVVRSNGLDARGSNPRGIEIDLRPNKDEAAGIGTGCLIAMSTPLQNHRGRTDGEKHRQLGWLREPKLQADGDWNECVIICRGERLVVEMNGMVVNEASGIKSLKGQIVLRNQKTAVEFREIRLLDLEPAVDAGSTASKQVTNLIELADPVKHGEDGKWRRTSSGIVGTNLEKDSRLTFPYVVPEEYDLQISLTRIQDGRVGANDTHIYLPVGRTTCTFGVRAAKDGSGIFSFWGSEQLPKGFGKPPLGITVQSRVPLKRKITLTFRVRKSSVQVIVGEKPIFTVQDFSVLRQSPGNGRLAIGSWQNQTVFHSVNVTAITGQGRDLQN
jgi:hypothetical protein